MASCYFRSDTIVAVRVLDFQVRNVTGYFHSAIKTIPRISEKQTPVQMASCYFRSDTIVAVRVLDFQVRNVTGYFHSAIKTIPRISEKQTPVQFTLSSPLECLTSRCEMLLGISTLPSRPYRGSLKNKHQSNSITSLLLLLACFDQALDLLVPANSMHRCTSISGLSTLSSCTSISGLSTLSSSRGLTSSDEWQILSWGWLRA